MPFKPIYASSKPQYNTDMNEPTTNTEPKSKTDQFSDQPTFFWKPDDAYGYFCQWYQCDMVDEEGQTFNCCEQYMMYHKARTFDDTATMAEILKETNPRKQKGLGKQVKGFSDREWDKVKYNVVVRGNMLKFSQCDASPSDWSVYPPYGKEDEQETLSLKELLFATGDRVLAEASRFDSVWGIGCKPEEAEKTPQRRWGQNLLGKAIMEVREKLRNDEQAKEREQEVDVGGADE